MSEIGITNVEGLTQYVLSHYDNCSTAIRTTAALHCLIVCMQHGYALHAGNLHNMELVAKERCGDVTLLLLLIIIKTVLTVPNSESVSAMHHPSPRLDGLYF